MEKNRPDEFGNLGVLALAAMNDERFQDHTRHVVTTMVDFKELMMMYTCAMKEVKTKFDVLNTEFNTRCQHNPISSITTRLKRPSSIVEKLMRRHADFSIQGIEDSIHDIAGVRVVCPYIDDIYTLADAFLRQDDITLVERKDYIRDPKPNGYRSLHLIVTVPVFFSEQTRHMKVEVQIRTIAMDFWASLEHQMKYKQDIPDEEDIVAALTTCADEIHEIDCRMLAIRQRIDAAEDTASEEEELLERLSRLDVRID